MGERKNHISRCIVVFELSGSRYQCGADYYKREHEKILDEVRGYIEGKRGEITGVHFTFHNADAEVKP